MHRNVDLHYQYLTSSYACMLSCPISLRPFVILEGTGLGPWGAQGQSDGGGVGGGMLCHQHPCGWDGSDLPSVLYVHWKTATKRRSREVCRCVSTTPVLVLKKRRKSTSGGCCGVVRDEKYLLKKTKKQQLPPIRVHNHLFHASVKLAANQHLVFIYWELRSECQCVGICSFLCHYREISMSSKEKGTRKYITTNCLFCGRCSEHVD